jgi:hypothetical protein
VLGAVAFATLRCEAQHDVVAVDESTGSPEPPPDAGTSGGTGGTAATAMAGSGGTLQGAGTGGGAPIDGGTAGASIDGGTAGSAGSGGKAEPACPAGPPLVPLTEIDGVPRSVCSAALARERMSHALCACEELNVLGIVRTDAFDSAQPSSTLTSGAAVGVNGQYVAGSYASIDGSLTISSSSSLSLFGFDVTGDVRLGGAATSTGPLRVGRDAWFARSVSVLVSAHIDGDLHVTPGSSLTGPFIDIGGDTVEAPFALDAPCRCDADVEFDLETAVADARVHNDNAAIGLAALPSVPAEGLTLELGCGRYFLTELKTPRKVRILVTGRAALFVAGDFQSGNLVLELAEGAELDWFIQGRLTLSAADRVGDRYRAGALRAYVGGASEIALSPSRVAMNLHAPRADVVLVGVGDLYGSVLARTIRAVLAVIVHYDRAVSKAGDSCGKSDVTACAGCGSCTDGLACIGGSCMSCTADADCCSPFVCQAGRCEPLLTATSLD